MTLTQDNKIKRTIIEVVFHCPTCQKSNQFVFVEGTKAQLLNCPLCGDEKLVIQKLHTVKKHRWIWNLVHDYFKLNKFCKKGVL